MMNIQNTEIHLYVRTFPAVLRGSSPSSVVVRRTDDPAAASPSVSYSNSLHRDEAQVLVLVLASWPVFLFLFV